MTLLGGLFLLRGTQRASTCVHPPVPSVLQRASSAMQRAVLAFFMLVFDQKHEAMAFRSCFT